MFGVVMFFFMLGIDLKLTPEGLRQAMPMAVAIALLTVFVTVAVIRSSLLLKTLMTFG